MSLRDLFAKAWSERRGLGSGWIVNLEPTYNMVLGAVGIVQGHDFKPETTLEQREVKGLKLDPNQKRDETPWQFSSNNEIDVSVGAEAKTDGAVGAIADGNVSVAVDFGNTAGVSIHGTAMWMPGYADIGVVRAAIVEAAREGRLRKGESIVVQQQVSGPGVLFTAEGNNARLEASAAASIHGGVLPAVGALSGKLRTVNSRAGAQMQSFGDGAVLAARVLYLGRRGWFWWRDFHAYGALDTDPDQIEETLLRPVEGDGDDSYFALVR